MARDFSGQDLSDSNFADKVLREAKFSRTIITNVNFRSADLRRAIFSQSTDHPRGRNPNDLVILPNGELEDDPYTDFYGANLLGAVFDHSVLWFSHFGGSLPNLSLTKLYETSFVHADLSHSSFDSYEFNRLKLELCGFVGATLKETNFGESYFTKCNFDDAQLDYASLHGYLSDCVLTNCSFRGAFLREVSFSRSDLRNCDFSKADLREARFVECNLQRASFRSADLSFADLSDAKVNRDALRGAKLTGTRMPDGSIHE